MRRFLARFRSSIRGNVAAITALSMLAITGLAGGSMDLSVLYSKKSAVQDSLDAAALYAASSSSTDAATLESLTRQAFAANIADKAVSGAQITSFAFDSSANTITATATGSYTPMFAQLIGVTQMSYQASTTTKKSVNGTLEVALVLDNTWSMSVPLDGAQTKIQVLKTAAQNLVDTIMTSSNTANGGVKVGVVPYADYVNVGIPNRTQSWVSVGADYSTTTTTPKTCTTITTKTTCTGGTRGTCTGVTDGVPYTYSCWIVPQTCTTSPVTPYQQCSGGTTSTTNYKFYGCVKNQVSSGTLMMPDPTTPYPGFLQTSQTCLSPIQALTSNAASVTSSITNLVVNIGGYKPETYIPGGLVWGVNLLSPAAPFTEGAAYDTSGPNKMPRKVLILMTDGSNTEYLKSDGTLQRINVDPVTGLPATSTDTSNVAKTYADQQKVCSYAKARNIEIYTIGFGVTDPTGLSNLKSCATDAAHYFDAQNSAALIAAFQTIAGTLSKVRISQ